MSAEQMHSPAWHQLREQILAKAVVHGKVILSSGKEADYYVDLRRVTLDHAAAPLVGQVMRELTSDLASEKAHGLQRRIEGPSVTGRAVLAVEDTSTTGASVLTAVDALIEDGATVVACAVIVDRGAGAAIIERGFAYRAAYSLADLGL